MYFKQLLLKYVQNVSLKRFNSNWIQPKGYDTSIKIYNCVAKGKVPLIVRRKDYVTWYTCGPTVYDSAHIGHASCYTKVDILQRILRNYFSLNLITVMNITDIDDKIIQRSGASTASEIAKKFEDEFWDDLKSLNIKKPDVIVRVTEKMPTIIKFVEKLIDEGRAYVSEDGSVYFSLSDYKCVYGKLQNIVDESENESKTKKKSSGDFALWKAAKPSEPSWDTKWGPGRPGWHVECSAMAGAVFGDSIDIHAGGIDLRFPHHENEEAQSCAHYSTQQWVNYWIHTGHLHLLQQEKMSKSLKNTISIREFLHEYSDCNIFRMACLMSHYRSNLEYSPEVMQTADAYLKRIKSFLNECEHYVNGLLPPAEINQELLLNEVAKASENIDSALKDDFNTAKVIRNILDIVGIANKMLKEPAPTVNLNNCGVLIVVSHFIRRNLNNFGLELYNKVEESSDKLENVMDMLTEFRQNVRVNALGNKNKDLLKYCDKLREDLKLLNITVQDMGKLSAWSK